MKTKLNISKLRASLQASLLLVLLGSCNVMKYVPEDEKLYTGAKVEVNTYDGACGADDLAGDVRKAVGPRPNSKVFGMRIGLWAHYKVANGDSGFFPSFINDKFGEEPVYLSDVDVALMEDVIKNRSINNGYFYPNVSSQVQEKERTASVDYTLNATYPYLLETYEFIPDSSRLDPLVEEAFGITEMQKGSRFDTELLKQERQRIDTYLKNRGFYNFNPDFFIFTSDTNQYKQRLFDLYLSVKKATPDKSRMRYRIRNIYVYPDYSADAEKQAFGDTIEEQGIYFIQNKVKFKPKYLREYITFEPGELYDKSENDRTTSRLSGLKYYQFAGVRYRETDTADADSMGLLDASILLTPGKVQDIRLELQAVTKSTNFAGPELIGSYRHKNLFNGGEVFNLSGAVSYEKQLSSTQTGNLTSFQFKLTSSISFPRFLWPWKLDFTDNYSVPRTRIAASYTLQDRSQYYLLHSTNFSYGYNWNSNKLTYWEVNPVSLTYTQVSQKSDAFQEILNNNPFLKRSFDDQFIPGLTGTLQYNELGANDEPNQFFTSFGLDAAGNLLGAVDGLSGRQKTILGLPYAQYVRGDVDFRYYLVTGEESKWTSRIFAGVGYPYGNSTSLPYIKQYFAGGPSSIRAFRVRSVGPGSYEPPDTDTRLSFFDQAGDIRLEFNTEYRFPLYSLLEGAVFFDAGNVWLWNRNPALPGGQFSSNWSDELAAGGGLGLRLDISVLVIRLDVAHPLRYPYSQEGSSNKWVNSFNFGDLVWNFAIGYPF